MTQKVDTSKDLGKAPVTARTLSVQAQAGIEKQRAEARQEADKILDREAIAVIDWFYVQHRACPQPSRPAGLAEMRSELGDGFSVEPCGQFVGSGA